MSNRLFTFAIVATLLCVAMICGPAAAQVNVARTATVSASSIYEGFPASLAVDGKLDTRWSLNSGTSLTDSWFQLEWAAPKTIYSVVDYAFTDIVSQMQRFDVFYWDGSAWQAAGSASAPFADFTQVDFASPITTTKLKLMTPISDWEIEVWGDGTEQSVTGIVTYVGSTVPAKGVTITAQGRSVVTGPDGTYTLMIDPVGTISVTASRDTYTQTKTVDVAEWGTAELNFEVPTNNLALIATASASTEAMGIYLASYVNDGVADKNNLTFRWASEETEPQRWVALTWAQPQSFNVMRYTGFDTYLLNSIPVDRWDSTLNDWVEAMIVTNSPKELPTVFTVLLPQQNTTAFRLRDTIHSISEIELYNGAVVKGVVRDGDTGLPVGGATITGGLCPAVSNADGTYQLVVPPDTEVLIKASKAPYSDATADVVTPDLGTELAQDLSMTVPDPGPQMTLQEIKASADGTVVFTVPLTVTARFPVPGSAAGYYSPPLEQTSVMVSYYAENSDRTQGIRVESPGHLIQVGQRRKIAGTFHIDAVTGEKYITTSSGTPLGMPVTPIVPLTMSTKALGGSGIPGGTGVDNVGLLVKITGRVTQSNPSLGAFYINDGAGEVRIDSPLVPAVDAYITVSGVCSIWDDAGVKKPLVRLADMQAASPKIAVSHLNGGDQIWMLATNFSRRSNDGGQPNFISYRWPYICLGCATMQFYRAAAAGASTQLDWWVQYDIPQSSVPGVSLTGSWGFWGHVGNNQWAGSSDYLVVNGDDHGVFPGVSNPTDAQWIAPLADTATADLYNRVFNRLWVPGAYGGGGLRYNASGWCSADYIPELRDTALTANFNVIDGKVSFRLYEREATTDNAGVAILCWTNVNYIPNWTDAQAALWPPAP